MCEEPIYNQSPLFFYIHVQHYMYKQSAEIKYSTTHDKNYLLIIRRFPKNHSCGSRVFFFLSKNYQITKTWIFFFYTILYLNGIY